MQLRTEVYTRVYREVYTLVYTTLYTTLGIPVHTRPDPPCCITAVLTRGVQGGGPGLKQGEYPGWESITLLKVLKVLKVVYLLRFITPLFLVRFG